MTIGKLKFHYRGWSLNRFFARSFYIGKAKVYCFGPIGIIRSGAR